MTETENELGEIICDGCLDVYDQINTCYGVGTDDKMYDLCHLCMRRFNATPCAQCDDWCVRPRDIDQDSDTCRSCERTLETAS